MYSIVYTKKAVGDIPNLKSAKLDNKAKALIELIRTDPYKTPPSYEKLQGDLKGAYSRRINIKHRLILRTSKTTWYTLLMRACEEARCLL